MRSFKVKVDADKADFFKELLDSLNFVSYSENSSGGRNKSKNKSGLDVKEKGTQASLKRNQNTEDEYDSMDSKRKSLEDIRKAMMNIDKLRNNR